MNSKQEQMWENLRDKDFREQFIDEHINVGIAFQIRSLRNRQNLKQSELAQLLGVKQPLVSSWENPNYGKYTLNTLKDLAKAFDVGLLVRFVPFRTLIEWTIDLTSDAIAPPSFNEEEKLHAASPVLVTSSLIESTKDTDVYDLKLEESVSSKSALSIPSPEQAKKELIYA
jgi:transcriptional regulator with XRE-family HTH domain